MADQIQQDAKQLVKDVKADADGIVQSAEKTVTGDAESLAASVSADANQTKSEVESVISKAFSRAKNIWTTEKDMVANAIVTLHRSEQNLLTRLEDAQNAKKTFFALGFLSGIVATGAVLVIASFFMAV